ncbi:MAG: hypothetical protein D6785_03995 [Planctomycetota bacterium]|nr:MAG: hypothetical protein D6785_03995 [Planctomycetota bacterium]
MALKIHHETLKVTTEPVVITFKSEPYVVHTFRGFAPVVDVQLENGEVKSLYISSSSLASGLMPLVEARGSFEGLKVRLKKDSDDRFAKYVVEEIKE